MRKIGVIIMVVLASCEERKMSTIDTKPDSTVADSSIAMANIQPLQKQFTLDKMYEHYINPSLIAYLEKNHPAWSVPDRNTWHPQLFNKYMGDSTLVNYVAGDFNCDGFKDFALLLDLGSNKLAAVVFLKDRDSFKTQILTELPSRETDKIEYRLKIFQPGNYEVADPDLETNGRKTTFKCPAVGVGLFEDLFEGGKDVFYWENGELHSCLILD